MYDGQLHPTKLKTGDVIIWDRRAEAIIFARSHANSRGTERLSPFRTDNKILVPYIHDEDDFQNIAKLIARVCHCDIQKIGGKNPAWRLVRIRTNT